MSESFAGLEITFALLVRTAWCAAILLLLVWGIQKFGAPWLSPRARYALWLLVAARLVILWTPTSPLSLVGQLEDRIANVFGTESNLSADGDFGSDSASISSPVETALLSESLPTSTEWAPHDRKTPVATWQWSDVPNWSIAAAIWALGVATFSIRLARDFWRLRSAVGSMTPITESRVLLLVRRIEKELALSKHTRILVSNQIASPAVTGVFRPALLIPAQFLSELSEKELEHVIRHELTHVKRCDVLVNWLLAGLGAAYWFFPLMRYLLSQLRKTRELACDAAVLRGASANERRAYGKTLLKVMEMVSEVDRPMLTFTVGVAGMVWPIGNFRKESKMMRERLELVVMDRSKRSRAGWLVGAMALMLIAVGFTEAQDANLPLREEEISVLTDESAKDRVYAVVSRPNFWSVEQSYDLANLLSKFEDPAVRGTKSASEAMQDWVAKVVRDSLWSNPKEVRIAWSGNTATIKHSLMSHHRFLKAIQAMHVAPELQFVMEVRINSLSVEDFKKLDVSDLTHAKNEAVRTPDHITGAAEQTDGASEITLQSVVSQSFLISEDQMRRVQTDLDKFPSHQRLQAPKLTTFNGQVAQITVGNTHPFVTGVELIKGVEQPRVEVLFDGTQMESQVIALGEEKAWLRLQIRKSEVDAEKMVKYPGGTVELQSPKLRTISQVAGVEIGAGQTLAIFLKAHGNESKEKVQAIFATLRSIKESPEVSMTPQTEPLKASGAKLSKITYPIGDVLVYKVDESESKSTDDRSTRLVNAELRSFVAVFKEEHPTFLDPSSGRNIEIDFDKLSVTITGTDQEINCFKEYYYWRKSRIENTAKALKSANQGSEPIRTTEGISDFNLLRLRMGVEFVPPKHRKARTVNSETTKAADPNDAAKKEQAIDKALQLTIETKFKDKPLSEALNLIAKGANINIIVDPTGLVEQSIQASQPVSLDLRKKPVSIRSALRLILDPLGLDFIVKNESLIITSKRLARSSPVTVAYDVAGSPFIRPLLPEFKNGEHANEEKVAAAFEKIQTIVKKTIPCFFEGNKDAEIQPFYTNLTLVISAPVEDQEKIADLLKQFEKLELATAERVLEEAMRR